MLSFRNLKKFCHSNFISWNHREPVYDIRTWNQEHTKYGKGVTLTLREMALLQDLMKEGE